MKVCCVCGLPKELDQFQKKKRNRDGLDNRCKACKREYDNAYYRKKPDRKSQIRAANRLKIEENKTKVFNYLLEHPCVECGEDDPVVLEFDHLEDKKKDIATMLGSAYSWQSIVAEIRKCQVLCANCHRRKTAKDFGWYAFLPL